MTNNQPDTRHEAPAMHTQPPPQLLTITDITRRVQLGRSTIYELIAQDAFPAPIKIGRQSRWLAADIDSWITALANDRQVAS